MSALKEAKDARLKEKSGHSLKPKFYFNMEWRSKEGSYFVTAPKGSYLLSPFGAVKVFSTYCEQADWYSMALSFIARVGATFDSLVWSRMCTDNWELAEAIEAGRLGIDSLVYIKNEGFEGLRRVQKAEFRGVSIPEDLEQSVSQRNAAIIAAWRALEQEDALVYTPGGSCQAFYKIP